MRTIVDIKRELLHETDLLADAAHELNDSRRPAALQNEYDIFCTHLANVTTLSRELAGDLASGFVTITEEGKQKLDDSKEAWNNAT